MADEEDQELTHEEIWDDAALVDSWNDAFEEYKKYHSIAARGEKVDVKTLENQDKLPSKAAALVNSTAKQQSQAQIPVNFTAQTTGQATAGASNTPAAALPAAPPGLASLPQTLLGAGQDENMKNIMMSWYYAGYYTGLYEGQQKAWAEMQQAG